MPSWASLAQTMKNLPRMWEILVRSLGWEDSLEEGMATHSSVLAWRLLMDRGAWRATAHGVAKSDTTEQLSKAHTVSRLHGEESLSLKNKIYSGHILLFFNGNY